MAQTGFIPCVANPAANSTAWPSAIPTSKKRSGKRLANRTRFVPDAIAAVIATMRGSVWARSPGAPRRLPPLVAQRGALPPLPAFFLGFQVARVRAQPGEDGGDGADVG